MRKMTRRQAGFTIVELLVVLAVLGLLSTLAIGAVLKSAKQGRKQRVKVMARALENALESYYTEYQKWPYNFQQNVNKSKSDNHERDAEHIWTVEGKRNNDVFRPIFQAVKRDRNPLLEPSSLFVMVAGKRMVLRDALENNFLDGIVGYPHPDNPDNFVYFTVQYNDLVNKVKVFE